MRGLLFIKSEGFEQFLVRVCEYPCTPAVAGFVGGTMRGTQKVFSPTVTSGSATLCRLRHMLENTLQKIVFRDFRAPHITAGESFFAIFRLFQISDD